MNKENTQKLLDDFPEMFFEDSRGEGKPTMFRNHIYCGDGWFDIIYNLCNEISPFRPKVMQIKEKFGGLRFYCMFPNEDNSKKGYDFIRKAEQQAYKTCEQCGSPGELRIHNGWRSLKCDQCYEQLKMEQPEEPYP